MISAYDFKWACTLLSLFLLNGCIGHKIDQETIQKDIAFITKTISENHPGPCNVLDPDFMTTLKAAHDGAMNAAQQVKTIEDYDTLLKAYVTHFNDSHMQISTHAKIEAAVQKPVLRKDFEAREIAPTIAWITLPNFEPDANQQIQLNGIIAQLPHYRTYDLIIFDVRGNGGGSSAWGLKIMQALFGKEYADPKIEAMHRNVYVDWRVSKENIEHIHGIVDRCKKEFGEQSPITEGIQNLYAGIKIALENGQSLYSQKDTENQAPVVAPSPVNKCTAKIMLLIDSHCFSACLDFIDQLKTLDKNVLLTGQKTGADALYIDIRCVELPSKLGTFCFPLKVYRNRPRESNQPYHPDITYPGNMGDSEAFEQWLKNEVITKLVNHI